MLFQLAGSPVQRRDLRYTFAAHTAAIITVPPSLHLPIVVLAVLMFCIKQFVDVPEKSTSQSPAGFMAFIIAPVVGFYCPGASTSAVNLTLDLF